MEVAWSISPGGAELRPASNQRSQGQRRALLMYFSSLLGNTDKIGGTGWMNRSGAEKLRPHGAFPEGVRNSGPPKTKGARSSYVRS